MAEGDYVFVPSENVLSFGWETVYGETPVQGAQTHVMGLLNEEVTLPDPEVEMHVMRNIGSGANAHIISSGARSFKGSIPITIQNGRVLRGLLGSYSVAGTYTHTMTCDSGKPPSFCMEALYVDANGDNFLRYYPGTYITGASLSAEEEGFLKATLDVESSDAINNANTASSVSQLDTEPFKFCEGVATYFGSTYARVMDFSVDVKRAYKARRYISNDGCKPTEINFGARDIEMTTTVIASDDTATAGPAYYGELLSPTAGGSTFELLFTRDAGDTFKITVTGASLKSAPHTLNPEAEDVPVELSLVAKGISITVVDSIEDYST